MKVNNRLKKRKKLVYDLMCCKKYTPMRAKELAIILQVPAGKREELHKVLDSLLKEGKISINKRGRYEAIRKTDPKPPSKKNHYLTGTFIGHAKGFGFVELEEEDAEDIFISEDNTGDALHKDKVQILLKNTVEEGKRREGKVVKVLERGMKEVVGTYEKNDNFGFLVPDNKKFSKDVFIPMERSKGAESGDKVIVEIRNYGSRNRNPEGKVIEILGKMGDKGVDVMSVAKSYDLPMEFPEKVLNQAEKIKEELNEGDYYGRTDLRDLVMVTIDGEDAKDLDDAVSLTKENGIYHLGVHIADVSNYVQFNSALDREAFKRGTSVYLVDRVIPMLPKKLSNGVCSLNEGKDRLALSCLMDIDPKGKVISHKIVESVIRVNKRMTYTNVYKILKEEDESVTETYKDLVPMFFLMEELSKILRRKRHKRGAIDFNFPESKVRLDEDGRAVEIYACEQNCATELIEDFMLMANETVAEEYYFRSSPFVYRTHENPDPEKMEAVLSMIHSDGFQTKKSSQDIRPKEVQDILKEIEGSESEPFFSRLILRSMKQAKYTTDCSGHFGLAAKYYCHFTSPIRRYPDLQIHRIIKETIRGRMTAEKVKHYNDLLDDVASQSSVMERRAEEVERETVKMKKAEYMQLHLNEVFEGVISGVTEWGFYVELPNTVEGMVHVNTLMDDYYEFDREHYCLKGERFGRQYKMGQKVKIRVENADLVTKTIDFSPYHEETEDR